MNRFVLCLAAACSLSLATVFAAEDIKLDGVKCIVATKNDAKMDKTREYKGGKVFFCCDNCPKKFDADQKPFATRANHQLVATEQAKQHKCPITGKDLNKDTEITVNGAKVQFCCDMCKAKVEKAEGDKKLELVFSDEAWKKADFKVEKKK